MKAIMEQKKSLELDAERALIGAALLAPEALHAIGGAVEPGDFTDKRHQVVWAAVHELSLAGESVDIVTVVARIGQRGVRGYLEGLINDVPSASSLNTYAKIVVEASSRRSLRDKAQETAQALGGPKPSLPKAMNELQAEILRQSARIVGRPSTAIADLANEAQQRIDAMQGGQEFVGLPTGWRDLDNILGGMHDSDLIIVAARPAMGKTSFGLNIIDHAIRLDKVALMFSLEMSAEQIIHRLLAISSGIDAWKIRQGRLNEADLASVRVALGKLAETKLEIDDQPSLDINQLRARVQQQHAKQSLDLVVVDYIQLMGGTTASRESRNREVSEISRGLKIIAKELGKPVVALSQLNRDSARREDRRPHLVDLRDSGSIEQDADVVMMLHREDYYRPEEATPGRVEVLIRKHRNGATGAIDLHFDRELQRYRSVDSMAGFPSQEELIQQDPF